MNAVLPTKHLKHVESDIDADTIRKPHEILKHIPNVSLKLSTRCIRKFASASFSSPVPPDSLRRTPIVVQISSS